MAMRTAQYRRRAADLQLADFSEKSGDWLQPIAMRGNLFCHVLQHMTPPS
jgi:hypothetical protein